MNDGTQVMSARALQPGHDILWYSIESVLGQGGFGITYLAHDRNLDRRVAIKEYLPVTFAYRHQDSNVKPLSDQQRENYAWGLGSFLKEAQTLARFGHDNIARVHSVFEQNNTAYMVMEYEQGDPLNALYRRRSHSGQPFFEQVFFPILDGLQQIHELGFIHRDIKPSNIYIRANQTPVLLDFGSARQTSSQDTGEMTTLVSQGYTPLEQYSANYGEQGPWTDVYALGATLYEGISGKKPAEALSRSACRLRERADLVKPLNPEDYPDFSPQFLKAIDAALALEPEKRPESLAIWRAMFGEGSGSPDVETVAATRMVMDTASSDSSQSDIFDERSERNRSPGARAKRRSSGELVGAPGADSSTRTRKAPEREKQPRARQRSGNSSPGRSGERTSRSHDDGLTSQRGLQERNRRVPPAAMRDTRLDDARRSPGEDPWDLDSMPADAPNRVSKAQKRAPRNASRGKVRRRKTALLVTGLALLIITSIGVGLFFLPESGNSPDTLDVAALARLPAPAQPMETQMPVELVEGKLSDLNSLAIAYRQANSLEPDNEEVQRGVNEAQDELRQLAERWNSKRYPDIAELIRQIIAVLPVTESARVEINELLDRGGLSVKVSDVVALINAGQIVNPAGRSVLDYASTLSPDEFSEAVKTPAWQAMMQSLQSAAVEGLSNRDFDTTASVVEAALTIEPANAAFVRLRDHLTDR